MNSVIRMQRMEIIVDMSPEFAAQLDIPVEDLLDLVDLEVSSGPVSKIAVRLWTREPGPTRVLFKGAWDRFDNSALVGGADAFPVRVYFSSLRHSRKRARALSMLRAGR